MPNPVYPKPTRTTPENTSPIELTPENAALADEIIEGIRRQRPHDAQAQVMTANQLIRMQLLDLVARLRASVPDYFPAKPSAPPSE